MSKLSSSQLGYFVTYNLWQDAAKLLTYQLERKKHPNKHFNTLSMFYYEKLGNEVKRIEQEKYFKQRIANNLFYGLSTEFGIYPYVQPKGGLALRNYVFLTYPIRCLYYSIGLYLLKLSNDFLKFASTISEVEAHYGGNLGYDGDSLLLSADRVYYKTHYNKFRKSVIEVIDKQDVNTVCLRLDISSYFDSIKILLLLELLSDTVKPAIKRDLNFDLDTIENLRFFFEHMSNGYTGIPQMDNGIISDFIGYLYLRFGDMFIHDLLQNLKVEDSITDYKFFRYVDDMYLFIQLKPNISEKERDRTVTNIGNQIADLLNRKLSLTCNKKTGYYRLAREKERDQLRNSLKRVSPDEPLDDDDNSRTPQERADDLFKELRLLKRSELDTSFEYSTNGKLISIETLKDVFSAPVDNILNASNNKTKLQNIFSNFNFDLVRVSPAALITIICRQGLLATVLEFEAYLLRQSKLTNKEVDLILRFLAHEDFRNKKLLVKLKQDPFMEKIIDVFETGRLLPRRPGYFELSNGQINKLLKMDTVIHQIRNRQAAEKQIRYSAALNHLLNEIHGICYEINRKIDPAVAKKLKNYGADEAVSFLQSINVPNTIILQIRNLFDRRNFNTVSHPGSVDSPSQDVTKSDYYHYHKYVGECLTYVLK